MKKTCAIILAAAIASTSAVRAAGPEAGSSSIVRTSTARPLDPKLVAASVDRWSRAEPKTAKPGVKPMPQVTRGRYSRSTRSALIFAGAVAGLVAGGYAGMVIERNYAPCICDDPGLQGILYGAPIGAVLGGVLTSLATR